MSIGNVGPKRVEITATWETKVLIMYRVCAISIIGIHSLEMNKVSSMIHARLDTNLVDILELKSELVRF